MSALVLVLVLSMAGCSSMSKTEKGVVIGGGSGAVVGGAVGKVIFGETAKGAIVGAVVGGAAGAIIGRQMDKQAQELEKEIKDAEIARVGEGIVVTFDSGLLFDFDSAELQPAARSNLADLSESIREYDNTELMIVGHTDDIGEDTYNDRLSVRRAESAAAYLFEQGVTSARVTTLGKGETDPIATNDTDDGRQLNRRVEVVIYASEEYRESLQTTEG
ncbi:MAG TPA: OmpA family protein [Rhodothermales bacterium]|nr:OmpA family protein [Rhodothermales bacterium]